MREKPQGLVHVEYTAYSSKMQELLNVVGQEGPEHLKQLLLFVQYVSKLKNEILLAHPSAQDTQTAPLNLPDSVESFLAAMCNMCPEEVPGCWSAVRKLVWNMEMLNDKAVSIAFQQHGMDFGFCELTSFYLQARPTAFSFRSQLISSIPYVQQS